MKIVLFSFLISINDLFLRLFMAKSHFLLLRLLFILTSLMSIFVLGVKNDKTSSSYLSRRTFFSGRICGKNITSCIEVLFVNSIVSLSIPIPIPEVGGIPYSRALRKS